MDSKELLRMNEKDIAQILIGFYQGLFESANPCSIDQAVADIPPLVTFEMNDMLQEEYTRAEVDTTLHQMEGQAPMACLQCSSNIIGKPLGMMYQRRC